MSYRDDLVEENNALRNEVADQVKAIRDLRLILSHTRLRASGWAIASLLLVLLLVAGVMFLQVRAPLSANTRGAAEEFCDALDKQTREEQEQ